MFVKIKTATTLAEVKAALEQIEEAGSDWFSNLLADDSEIERWIEKGQISFVATPVTVAFFRKRYGCQRLYFSNTRREALAEDLRLCLPEISGKIITSVLDRNNQNASIKDLLRQGGFSHYALLKRVVKINEPKPLEDISVEYATLGDLPRIEEILQRYFDPLLDHWPDKDEIVAAIEKKRILVARCPEDQEVVAIDSFERKGKTVWGRYWASIEEFRSDIPYGAILADQYMTINSDARKFIGWVENNNHFAVRMNRAIGLNFDGTEEEVFITSVG